MLLLEGHTLLIILSAAAGGYPNRHGCLARCYDGIKERKEERDEEEDLSSDPVPCYAWRGRMRR